MSRIVKHRELTENIRKSIAQRQYLPGHRIDTEENLMSMYGVSRQTVRQAIASLKKEGVLVSRRGSGTYVNDEYNSRTMNIGVITTYITEYISPRLLSGIEEVLSANKYNIIMRATRNSVGSERELISEFLENPVDGLIIEGTKTGLPNPNIPLYNTLHERGIPFVFINGYYPELNHLVYVRTDDFQGGFKLVEYLAKLGHTRIAGVFKSDDLQGHERYAGYLSGLLAYGLPMIDDYIFWFNTLTHEHDFLFKDREVFNNLISVVKKCSAIVCYSDEIAIRLINMLSLAGFSIPQDISVVSFDNSTLSDLSRVPITSMDHPKEQLGHIAAQKLLNMINGEAETSLVMPWDIIVKQSSTQPSKRT
jgi:GntR family transcriptional regulator, arabinose operon transcriptional repressor